MASNIRMPGTDNNITAGITPTSSITPSITMITPTTSANNLNIINNNNNNGNNNGLASLAFYDHSDQELMLQENKYRQYALAIDKALKSFEYTSEWADLVNALGKLNRVLNNNSKFGKIPRRFIVGQRLAQCMHPLLPSGVHLKALETYDLIFNILGPEQLLADLTIYSNGLFPLLGYAAINVRPSVLDLYDRHLLPLGERLQLALDGFLISILPCYEEVSDSFQRTDGLLLKVADGVGIAYFYGALWRCILQNSSIRLQAITFVLMHFNKKRSLKEQAHVLGLCMRTLVQAICSALLDQHILVQRAILDLLITIFPIHFNLMNQVEQTMLSQQQQQQPNNLNISPNKSSNTPSQSITPQLPPPPLQPTPQQPVMSRKYFKRSEMIVIITAALTVLLRRDFSLNRRLSAWFFGGDSGASMAGGGGGNSNNNNNANQSTSNNNNIGSFVTTTKSGSTATGTTGTTLLGTSSTIGSNNNNNYDNNLSSTTSTSTSAETKAKRKKLIYYDTYSKDLVNEAFKRCITNPLTAITSFLPPSALTNSFITFTMPFIPTMGNNDTYRTQTIISSSSSSSPSSSTLSLHTNSRHLYRNNSLHHHHHSNQSRSISSMTGLYQSLYSSMSTFWPYRLLICIMDQRDIAIPILDKLCIDILRGLYHEFELLTTEVPPPNTEINDDNDADDDNDDEENINTSHHSGGNKNQMDRQTNDFIDNISSTTTTTLSSSSPISSTKQTSLNINKKKKRKIINKRKKKKLKKKISTKSNEPVCKLSNNNNNNVTNVNENQQQQQQTKIFDENIIDNNNDVIKSNEQVFNDDDDDDEDVGEINSEALDDIDDALLIDHDDDEEEDEVEDANRSKQQLNADGLISNKNNDDNDNNIGKESTMKLNIHETNSPSLDIFSDDDDLPVSKRDNRNLFQNIRHNVKQKFIKLQFPLGQNKSNDSGSETNSNRNMKQVMKTFMTRPLRLKIRPGDTINDGKLLVNRFGRKKRDQKNINIIDTKNQNQTPIIKDMRYQSANNSSSSTNNANNNASNQNNQNNNNNNKEFDNVDDDDSVFILPHQHYYWNPYYQQLSKEQRQELLQELDRVMHLLFTNIGVEFIWNQLAFTFNAAIDESIALRKILHILHDDNDDDDSSEDEDEAEDSFNDDDDDDNEEEENNDVGNDTILQSLLWIHNLVPTRLLESLANNYSIGSSTTSCCSSSTLSSSSSSTYASPRLCSPEFKNFNDNDDDDEDLDVEEEEEEESDVDDENGIKKSTLKTKLLISLMNRCRQCGKITKFSSPVQPVGTAWVTILESCTLARFLLGDSKPYPHDNNIDNNGGGGQKFNNNNNIDELSSPPTTRIDITNHSTSSLFVNSISVSMNRCSALEPLEVGTANYTFLIHFLDHVLQLICQSVKSFTPIDLRASIELCLALCSKLKPAIMQTFTRRYRRELNVMKNKDFINDTNNVQQSRKPTITTWFETYGQQKQQQPNIRSTHLKTRSSPSVSSNSAKPSNTQLELVREETEEDDEDDDNGEQGEIEQPTDSNDNDNGYYNNDVDNGIDQCEFNDDFQIELVVDGILKFFATFIEKILVKKSSNKIETSEAILDYFRRIMLRNISNDQLNIQNIIDRFLINRHQCYYPEIIINCQLLPLYQLFCELLIEIGTIPLLSSPAFLFKKREQKNQINLQQFIIDNNKQQSQQMISKSFDNIRWFIYLMTLTSNGIGSCTHWHNNNNNEQQTKIKRKSKITTTTTMMDHKSLSCCQLRHVSYTSLATILDLMTMTRAYIVSQPEIYPKPISFGNDEFPMPSYVDMTIIDLFPRTFVARRLNFFPLIHPKMLQFVYESTTWFRLVASGLWSNLSPEDSVLHHSTCALLQQLHSISNDESICEAVICDEMIGGQNNGVVGVGGTNTVQSSSLNGSSSYRSFMDGHHQPRFQLSLEQESRQIPNNMNIVHRARNKFALMFSIIRDIRFISERLALVVNALASAARSASDGDIDIGLMNTTGSSVSGAGVGVIGAGGGGISYSDIDPLTINENSSSSKLISQLEIEIATGMDSNHYQSLMNMAIVNNFQDLHRLLRITCPISPIALCSTLKRHFDRPLFIMLDALTQRRNLSDQYSISSDWLLRCIKQSNLFGTKNLMFTSPNGFGVTSEFHNHYLLNNANAAAGGGSHHDHHYLECDIGRILEPLLFILLHPNTARLSIKNVNILRYTRSNNQSPSAINIDNENLLRNYSTRQEISNDSTLETTATNQEEESKIYAITPTNGNVIYHVRRRPPPPPQPHSRSPTSNVSSTSTYGEHVTMKIITNPMEKLSSTIQTTDSDCIEQIVQELMDRIVSEIDQDVDIDEFMMTDNKLRTEKKFPGMASSHFIIPTNDNDHHSQPNSATANVMMGNDFDNIKYRNLINNDDVNVNNNSGRKLRFAEMHQHLLLYERRYDSLRTTYALDTIIAMIETWPSHVLYSMSTSKLFNGSILSFTNNNNNNANNNNNSSPFVNCQNISQSSSSIFDGTRSAQIKILYQRHHNSIQGDGFYPNHNQSLNYQSNINLNNMNSTNTATNVGTNRARSRSKQHILESSSTTPATTTTTTLSNDENITLLELIIKICLKYLCSYYPSCPADMASTMTANKLQQKKSPLTRTTGLLEGGLLDDLFLQIRSNHCIDLEAIYGNQRVRLLAAQSLSKIFRNLSQMIENRNHNDRNKHHKRQPSESLLCFNQSKLYAQYLKELFQRCQVQRNILQCLATSVWHYQQKFPSNNPNTTTTNSSKNDNQKRKFKTNPSNITTKRHETSYLFPETKYSTKLNPADILFVKEILDYNDYPENLSTTTTNQFDFYNIKTFNNNHYNDDDDPNNQHGFHDEFEKCLLHLIEQVMILESRIQSALVDTTNVTSGNSKTLSHSDSSSIVQRVSVKEITEMNFDPDLPLLGQTLLNGSLYYALQQNYRRHIHNEWLSFIESSLHYAGRFMPRLVLTAVNQLCRNIDSITKEIEQFARTSCFVSSQLNLPPFVYKHFAQTLQGISMIYSYCLLDRNQFDLLAPVLTELFNDNQDDWSRLFGLTSNRRYRRRYFDINNSFINEQWTLSQNGNMATSVSNNESTGAIQAISSILHNFMVMPISGSNTTGTTSGGSNSSTVTTSTNDQTDQSNPTDSDIVISQQDTLPNNLALTRQRILDYTSLNRVLTALFQVWCTMIVREEINNNGQTLQTTSLINQQQSACCHPYVRQFYSIDTNHNRNNEKNCRYSQSNCSLGWSSSIYTGWYITGSSMMLGQAIVTILNIVAVSNGISLMKSIARVWHDLRDRSLPVNNSNPTNDSSLLADSIDMVITPATSAQQKLVQLISSLQPILNLEYLIQIVRAVLKPSSSISTSSTSTTTTTAATINSSTSSASSITTEVESTQHSFTSNPFDNIFLIEVSLLEFFLAYIRTCPGELLLKVCRSMIALIKDSFALNLTASVPYETFWPRSKQRQPIIPSSSVQINFQPLINIHLLAIMHHFVVASPSVEDRRAQKELQDVTQRLIDANISVAGGRLLPSRFWSFRRNFEVMPVNSDHQIGHHHQQYQQQQQQQTGRPSPTATHRSGSASTTPITEEALSNSHNEQNISFKRGLFRSSASVQFQPDRSPSNTIQRTMTPTNDDYHHLLELKQQQQQQQQQDSLLFGLFNFNLSYLSTGSNQSNHQDLANTSQNLFYSYFCIKALYAMAEFAAPVLDVVYASEEKEKMIPLITNLMSYVIPYLKSHSQHNLPCFDACSRLLASFSGYQYTRKAWRRDSLELLLDPAFFQMPPECLQSWRTIIDHLMTHDKNTFREFLQRMSIAQSPSVSFKIFVPSSTKDQESEPRAQLVKRLAFILFCSEKDQYQRYMAEIQEKLIEIHRTSQQQSQSSSQLHSQSILQSQVLLAFRVILLRMSPHYLASLWPFIYTEMFQVFLSIEQALLKVIRDEQKNDPKWSDSATISPYNIHLDIPDFLATQSSIHRSSSSSNFLQQHRTSKLEPKIPTAQLQLFLNACKLLDLALLLPSDILPQFQLHKWAFINTDSFPLSTNIRQPIDWLGGISPFAEPIVLNLQTDSSIISNISQQSSEQQTTSSTSSLGMVENLKSLPETISLNSTITFDSPQSLPANLNSSSSLSCSSTITLNHQCNNNNNNEATFIPHVVFINHLLNYLTDSIPIISQSNVTMCPLLTMSTIESIHDLHPFFAAVLSRSNQNTMFTTSTQQQQQQHCNQSNFERQPNESSSTSSSSYRRSLENRTHSANASINSQKQQQQSDRRKSSKNNGRRKIVADQLLMNNCGGCSLDELYINIDRIIANDFLEPLPSSSTNLSSD